MSPLILRKTRSGMAEVDDRRSGLPRALRNLLILVNGRDDAATLIAQADSLRVGAEGVRELIKRGFVEPVIEHRIDPAHDGDREAPRRDQSLRDIAPLRSVELAAAYAAVYMRDFARDASDTFSQLFSMVTDEAELLALIENCAQVMVAIEGVEAAASFAQRVRSLLPIDAAPPVI